MPGSGSAAGRLRAPRKDTRRTSVPPPAPTRRPSSSGRAPGRSGWSCRSRSRRSRAVAATGRVAGVRRRSTACAVRTGEAARDRPGSWGPARATIKPTAHPPSGCGPAGSSAPGRRDGRGLGASRPGSRRAGDARPGRAPACALRRGPPGSPGVPARSACPSSRTASSGCSRRSSAGRSRARSPRGCPCSWSRTPFPACCACRPRMPRLSPP
jgi:hypothetical protein